MRRTVVLFDLDGTLIDSGPMILASMRHACQTVLGYEPDEERIRASVGGPGLVAQMRDLDPSRVDELVAAYRAHNAPLHEALEMFPGMAEVLQRLRDRGHLLAIVTAKRRATVELAFARFPLLAELTETLVADEDTERHKPDPDPLLEALARLGAAPHEAAYVGDSPFDIRAARAAEVLAVAVGWGGIHDPARLAAESPDALLQRPSELLDVL